MLAVAPLAPSPIGGLHLPELLLTLCGLNFSCKFTLHRFPKSDILPREYISKEVNASPDDDRLLAAFSSVSCHSLCVQSVPQWQMPSPPSQALRISGHTHSALPRPQPWSLPFPLCHHNTGDSTCSASSPSCDGPLCSLQNCQWSDWDSLRWACLLLLFFCSSSSMSSITCPES